MASNLANQVRRREQAVKRYVEFALELISQIGKIESREEFKDHSKIKKIVKEFGEFDFVLHAGMTCMGGNEIVIIHRMDYHGHVALINIFKVYWQASRFDIDQCRVDIFELDDPNKPCFRQLEEVIKNKESILAQMKKAEDMARDQSILNAQKVEAEKALTAKAKRLGLLPADAFTDQ